MEDKKQENEAPRTRFEGLPSAIILFALSALLAVWVIQPQLGTLKADAPITQATAQPAPVIKPTAEPKETGCSVCGQKNVKYGERNTDEKTEELAKAHYETYWPDSDYEEADTEAYRYACIPNMYNEYLQGEGNTNATLESIPYNMHVPDEENWYRFATNKQLAQEIGIEQVEAYADLAGDLLTLHTEWGKDVDVNALQAKLEKNMTPKLAEMLATRSRVGENEYYALDVLTNPLRTYVYRSTNDEIRVRMEMDTYLHDVSETLLEKDPELKTALNVWSVQYQEVSLHFNDEEKIDRFSVYDLCQPYAADAADMTRIQARLDEEKE